MAYNSSISNHYVWRDYSQQPYRSLILTLNNFQALSLLAFLAAFIAYAQTRWWIITRHLLIRILRPVQLADPDNALSLHHLSQSKAIKALIFKEKGRDNFSMISVSRWFGAVSLFNVLLFTLLGTIIPYCLTGGLGPAKVQSRATYGCDGFEAYSTDATQLAESFYTQCRLNSSADAAACGYMTRTVDSHPQLNSTLDSQCPFMEHNCESFGPENWFHAALRVEYLDMRPSEYGLNADSRIWQSHSLTCAPVKVRWFQVPYGKLNATVFWVGYNPTHFNQSETYASTGESVGYHSNALIQPGPFKLKSATVYELVMYPNLEDHKPRYIIENFHPGLKRDNGDMFIVMLKNGLGVPGIFPTYLPWREQFLRNGVEDKYDLWSIGAGAVGRFAPGALGCFEQYRLCFDKRCTEWSNSTHAASKLFQLLESNYDENIGSEVLKVQSLLSKATSLQSFMHHHHRAPLMVRSMWNSFPELGTISMNATRKQWHWEVRSWFEMAFLTAKFSLLISVQGVKKRSNWPADHFNNTNWICDKLLFLDGNSTNINFIGLVVTFSGLLVLCLLSLMERNFILIKHVLEICWKVSLSVGAAWQRLWRDIRHDLALAYRRLQRVYKTVFRAICRSGGLIAEFVKLDAIRRLWAHQSRHRDDNEWIDDDEIPAASASIGLENLASF